MEGYKIAAIVGFVILIAAFGGYIIAKGDSIFMSEVHLKYADGCIENYTDSRLVGEECVLGRAIEREREEQLEKRLLGDDFVIGDIDWNTNTQKKE